MLLDVLRDETRMGRGHPITPAIDEQACLSDTPVHKYLLDWLTASCKSLRLPPQAFVFLDDGNWGTGS
jgi:hypothetical protein